MKKLFGKKAKGEEVAGPMGSTAMATPIHASHARFGNKPQANHLVKAPPGQKIVRGVETTGAVVSSASTTAVTPTGLGDGEEHYGQQPYPFRPPSPSLTNTSKISASQPGYSSTYNGSDGRAPKKQASAGIALGMLAALDPNMPLTAATRSQAPSHEYIQPPEHKKEKRSFWNRSKDKDPRPVQIIPTAAHAQIAPALQGLGPQIQRRQDEALNYRPATADIPLRSIQTRGEYREDHRPATQESLFHHDREKRPGHGSPGTQAPHSTPPDASPNPNAYAHNPSPSDPYVPHGVKDGQTIKGDETTHARAGINALVPQHHNAHHYPQPIPAQHPQYVQHISAPPPPMLPRAHLGSDRTLTTMIGYLMATSSEDWSVVLEVCDRASSSEQLAKEAVRALRSEFKRGTPPTQLSAAKLWAIMLRNASDTFIAQSRAPKFLATIEGLLCEKNQHVVNPVVRERLMEIVAAAAFASGRGRKGSERDGFRGLWLRVKPPDKPDEGIPFDSEDAMFTPPIRGSQYDAYSELPSAAHHGAPPLSSGYHPSPGVYGSPLPGSDVPPPPPPKLMHKRSERGERERDRDRSGRTRNRIIPVEEDIRRLFQECRMGTGNANLLSEALINCTPSALKKSDIINEFYLKCRKSQELIFAQIDWASAGAERSRLALQQKIAQARELSSDDSDTQPSSDKSRDGPRDLTKDMVHKKMSKRDKDGKRKDRKPKLVEDEETVEEKLLASLLAANEELLEALRQYDDLARIADEKRVEARSRKEVRGTQRDIQTQQNAEKFIGGSVSRPSRSPSPAPSSQSHSYTPSVRDGIAMAHNVAGLGGYIPNHRPHPLPLENHSLSNLGQERSMSNLGHDAHHQPTHQTHGSIGHANLAPPPKAPHGPRSPGPNRSMHSRTPSPTSLSRYRGDDDPNTGRVTNGHGGLDSRLSYADENDNASSIYYPHHRQGGVGHLRPESYHDMHPDTAGTARADDIPFTPDAAALGMGQRESVQFDPEAPDMPSEKALGKRRAPEQDIDDSPDPSTWNNGPITDANDPRLDPSHPNFDPSALDRFDRTGHSDSDSAHRDGDKDGQDAHWRRRPPTQYVYDAAAERTQQLLNEALKLGSVPAPAPVNVNGVGVGVH